MYVHAVSIKYGRQFSQKTARSPPLPSDNAIENGPPAEPITITRRGRVPCKINVSFCRIIARKVWRGEQGERIRAGNPARIPDHGGPVTPAKCTGNSRSRIRDWRANERFETF